MTSKAITALWKRIHAAAPERCTLLRRPASKYDIESLRSLDLPLPPAFVNSLRLHDGEEEAGGLFPGDGHLFSVDAILLERDIAFETEAEFPDYGEFDDDDQMLRPVIGPVRPLLDSDLRLVFMRAGDTEYALDFDPEPGGWQGQVIRYNNPANDGWAVCAPSFESFLTAFARRLEAGPIEDGYAQDEDEWIASDAQFEDDLEEEDDNLVGYLNEPVSEDMQCWPPLRELPAMRAKRLDLATLVAAGRSTGQWQQVRELADGPTSALSESDRLLLEAHAALQQADMAAGLAALAALPPEAMDESALLLRIDLLDEGCDFATALTELSLAIEAGGSARLRARRARLHLLLSGETPYPDSPAKAMRWLGSPAGQQHGATCRDRAVEDLRAALAGENRIGWRAALGDALIESERWDEAIAVHESLLERLQATCEEDDPRLARAEEGLERARARGEGYDEDGSELLEHLDEVLASLHKMRDEFGSDDDDMNQDLSELRDTLASMIEHDTQNRSRVEANPDLIDEEAEAVAQQLARQHLDTPERFAPFPENEIDRPTRRWLDGAQRELEAHGFRCLGTVEPVRNTEVNGQRVPLRVLASADAKTIAAVWRLQGPTQAYEVVDFESELEDGRVFITNNSGAANPFAPPPGLEQIALPLGTPPSALFEAHHRRLNAAGIAARALPDLDAVLALQEKQRVIKREHARAEGWVSEGDLRNLLGSAYSVLGAQVRSRLTLLLG